MREGNEWGDMYVKLFGDKALNDKALNDKATEETALNLVLQYAS